VKEYLENYDDKYKGYILLQYVNNQEGTYTISFLDPETRERFQQTFMQVQITEILAEMQKIHDGVSKKPRFN
jgi:hypothetical protein